MAGRTLLAAGVLATTVPAWAEPSPGTYLPGAGVARPGVSVTGQAGAFVDGYGGDSFVGMSAGASGDPTPALGIEALAGAAWSDYGADATFLGLTARWRFPLAGDRLAVAPWLAGSVVPRSVVVGDALWSCGLVDERWDDCAPAGATSPIIGGGAAIEGGGRHWRGDLSIPLVVGALRESGDQIGWGAAPAYWTLLTLEAGLRWEGRDGRDAIRLGTIGLAPGISGRYGLTRRVFVSGGVSTAILFNGFHVGLGGRLGPDRS
jgi:hypothetical protein